MYKKNSYKSYADLRFNEELEVPEPSATEESAKNCLWRFKSSFVRAKKHLFGKKAKKVTFKNKVQINDAPDYDRSIAGEKWAQRSDMEIYDLQEIFFHVTLEDYKRVRFDDDVEIFEVPFYDRKNEEICVSIDFLIERSRYHKKKERDGKPYWKRLMVMSQELGDEKLWVGRPETYKIQKKLVQEYRKMERDGVFKPKQNEL